MWVAEVEIWFSSDRALGAPVQSTSVLSSDGITVNGRAEPLAVGRGLTDSGTHPRGGAGVCAWQRGGDSGRTLGRRSLEREETTSVRFHSSCCREQHFSANQRLAHAPRARPLPTIRQRRLELHSREPLTDDRSATPSTSTLHRQRSRGSCLIGGIENSASARYHSAHA